MDGMLDGVRVLDLSRLLPGPAATAWMVGQGASVDRVEPPGRGDLARHIPPFVDEVGAYFAATSLGKRSLAVDLRHEDGRALIRRIVPRYDVLVEGFRPGVLEAMGLAPEVLHGAHPGLVIARLSGFGQTGPLATAPGHDINYVGLAGGLHAAPRPAAGAWGPSLQVADFAGAMTAAAGIAAALLARERTGRGRVLDVSLTESALWLAGPHVLTAGAEGRDLPPGAHPLSGGLAVYGTYRCADDRWITVGALEPKFQARLASGLETLGEPGSLERADLAETFARRPRSAWVEALSEACVGPLLSPGEAAAHPHLVAREAVVRLRGATFVRPPLGQVDPSAGLPGLGEHSEGVLADAGLSASEIDALVGAGVVERT